MHREHTMNRSTFSGDDVGHTYMDISDEYVASVGSSIGRSFTHAFTFIQNQ